MQQISVAVFDVDERKADRGRALRGIDEGLDESVDLAIGEDGGIVRDSDSRVEHGMPEGDAWLRAPLDVRLRKASRMRQLKSVE